MGKHRHYRVCIDGEKDHSSGGGMYDHLVYWLEKNPSAVIEEGKMPINISRTPPHGIRDIVVFMITRHNCRYRRTLTKIMFPCKDKETGEYRFITQDMHTVFDLRDLEQKNAYANLGHIYSPYNIWAYGINNLNFED